MSFEAWLQSGEKEMPSSLRILMRDESRNYEELVQTTPKPATGKMHWLW